MHRRSLARLGEPLSFVAACTKTVHGGRQCRSCSASAQPLEVVDMSWGSNILLSRLAQMPLRSWMTSRMSFPRHGFAHPRGLRDSMHAI